MVIWTTHALNQLKRIHDYIALDSHIYAKQVSQSIVDKTAILNRFSKIGKVTPELNQPYIRELSSSAYRILYEIRDDKHINVLAIVHKRQKLDITENNFTIERDSSLGRDFSWDDTPTEDSK